MKQPLTLSNVSAMRWFYHPLLWWSLLIMGSVVIYWPTAVTLHNRWTQWDGAYSHGYLMLGVCLIAIVRRFPEQCTNLRLRSPLMFSAVVVSALWSAGYATQVGLVEQVALYLLIGIVTIAVTGWQAALLWAFPFALIALSIPVWEVLIPPLQNMTTFFSTWVVRLLEIPAYIDNFSFSLPYGTVVIAGGCAGLNYLLMGVALSSINALYRQYDLRTGLLSIGLMVVLAIVGNWIRVTALILIAYSSQMKSALVYDHGMFGWWIFAAVFGLYLVVISRLREGGGFIRPRSVPEDNQSKVSFLMFIVMLALLLWTIPFFARSQSQMSPDSPPLQNSRFQAADPQAQALFPHGYSGFDAADYYQTAFQGRRWVIARLVYLEQKQGKEMIGGSNRLTDLHFEKLDSDLLEASNIASAVVSDRQPELWLWQYMIGPYATTDAFQGKLLQLRALLSGQPGAALWLAKTPCTTADCSAERLLIEQDVQSFNSQMVQPFQLYSR